MKQFPEQVHIKAYPQVLLISGVRGRNVYELTTRRQLVTGPGNSLDIVIQQRFVNATSPDPSFLGEFAQITPRCIQRLVGIMSY